LVSEAEGEESNRAGREHGLGPGQTVRPVGVERKRMSEEGRLPLGVRSLVGDDLVVDTRPRVSTASELGGVAVLPQVFGHLFPLIALDLDDPILHGPAGSTQALQISGQLDQTAAREASDHRHDLAAASAPLAEDADHAVIRGPRSGFPG